MNRRPAPRRALRAFTIVEIIVVIIIIGVLAAVVAPRLIGNIAKGKRAATEAAAANVVLAVNNFLADGNKLPSGTSGIEFLRVRPSDATADSWKEPYLENDQAMLDAWGVPFTIVVPGAKNVTFDIISYGKDGKPGGEGEDEDVIKP